MALSFSVFNKFKAIDGVTAPIRKMTKNVGRFGKAAVKSFRNADRKAFKLNKTLKTLLIGGGILAGAMLLRQGIGSVTSQFVQFDDAIIAAGARFKDIGPDVDDFTERIKGIKAAARDAGATTEFTATQAAKAIDFLARAGFTSAESIGSLVSMINLATASGEDFAAVADMSSDLLGAFGLNADNTAQKIKNLNRLNDVLVKTVNSANVTITDMFETMKQVGPIATGIFGADIEEIAAITGVLAGSGIKGTAAMTALKNIYLRLAAPASKARKILDALQISIDDGSGGARKMTDVMEELGGKISGLGKIKQAQVLDELFGKRAIAGGKNMIDNIRNVKLFRKELTDIGGVSQRTADLMRTSLGNRLKALNSALVEFGFKILENFEIKGKGAITGFTEAIRGIDVTPIVEGLKALVAIAIMFHKIISSKVVQTIGMVIGVFLALKLIILAVSVAVGILSAVMAINPFTLILIGAALLIVAIVKIVKHWGQIKAAFVAGLKWISDVHDKMGLFALLNPFTAILLGIKQLIKHKDKIAGFFGFGSKDEQPKREPVRHPISPNAGLVNTIREERETRGRVDVNFSNLPKGTEVKQSGDVPGFDLDLGFAGA